MATDKKTAGQSAAKQLDSPSPDEVLRMAQQVVNDQQGIPPRIREHLDKLRAGLALLVEKKVPVKTISDTFMRRFTWKVSQSHLRAYLREEFKYPAESKSRGKKAAPTKTPVVRKPPSSKKAAAKKAPAKAARAKPRTAGESAKAQRGS